MKRHFRNIVLSVCIACLTGVLLAFCGGGGGGGEAPADTGPATIYPRFVYVANYGDNSVSTYVVDAATGRLKYIGKAAAGMQPSSVTIDPSGKYVYAANRNGNSVSQYTVGADGALTPMTIPTVATGSHPLSVTIDPSGKYAYVANDDSDDVSQYTIGADGSLTPMTSPSVAAGTDPVSVIAIGSYQ
jgi:VCBS repeat-containing protein